MSVPAAQGAQGDRLASFYGRSYPRASIVLDANGAVDHGRKLPPPSAVAPLLDWASKAAWNKGGGRMRGADPQPPKKPFTPLFAFLASKQAALQALHPHLGPADLLALAKADAAEQWDKLSDEEHQLYATMAEEDAERYERELQAFEAAHPAWAAQQQQRRARAGKRVAKPKAPLTAWRAFVLLRLQQRLEERPELREAGGLQAQIEVMKEAAPVWKAMSAEERQPFADKAAEDRTRWEAELEQFPEYKAALASKAAAAAAEKAQAAAKKEVLRAAGARPRARARARALPRATAKGGKRAGRGAKRRKVAVSEDEESEAVSDSEAEAESEPELSASDSDADASSDEEPEATGQGEEPAEEQPGAAEEPEVSDAEEEQPEAEDAFEFVAATPAMAALPGAEEAAEAEAEEDALRGAECLTDLGRAAPGSQERGLLGRVATFMMSGLKAFGGASRLSLGASPLAGAGAATPPPGSAGGAALVGATFVKHFGGQPFTGTVASYIPEHGWFHVTYDDGDEEELPAAELQALLTQQPPAPAAGAAPSKKAATTAGGAAKERQGGRKRRR